MSEEEKLELLQVLSGESDGDTLSAYLKLAGYKICRVAYPFDLDVTEVPDKYGHVQVEIAAYLLDKRGANGEIAHSENGISRSYESADVPASMLRGIAPMCGVPK